MKPRCQTDTLYQMDTQYLVGRPCPTEQVKEAKRQAVVSSGDGTPDHQAQRKTQRSWAKVYEYNESRQETRRTYSSLTSNTAPNRTHHIKHQLILIREPCCRTIDDSIEHQRSTIDILDPIY